MAEGLIGFAAVVLTVGLGEGAQKKVSDQISALGSNLLAITPGSSTSSSGIRGGFGADRRGWVNVEEPHELVRFDFGFLVYELTDYAVEAADGAATCTP